MALPLSKDPCCVELPGLSLVRHFFSAWFIYIILIIPSARLPAFMRHWASAYSTPITELLKSLLYANKPWQEISPMIPRVMSCC